MKRNSRFILLVLLSLLRSICMAQQGTVLLHYIQTKSDIREGGSNLYNYKDETYVISVASLDVGDKNELNCKKVGKAKAQKEMLSFINGSNITSYTELAFSETIFETIECKKIEAKQEFVEYIKEEVIGTANQIVPLGGWYSDDGSIYFYAIYKIIKQ